MKKSRLLLVPPTWRKIFGAHLTDVWDGALAALKDATRIVILGFSMPTTDTHFKYLLASGLRENISLRHLLFVNPALSETEGDQLLRKNLFSILRPELEVRGIAQLEGLNTESLLLGNSEIIHRAYGPEYLRITAGNTGYLSRV
jgi:hypothetical protein